MMVEDQLRIVPNECPDFHSNSLSPQQGFSFLPLSRELSSFSNVSEHSQYSSSKSDKVVNTCKNCSYSFRVSAKRSSDFCSKDCETCFTVFYNMNSPSRQSERSALEIREGIFHFQQSRMIDDEHRPINQLVLEQMKEDFNTLRNHGLPKGGEGEKSQGKKRSAKDKGGNESNKRGFGLGRLLFTSPRPIRPALHAFF